MLSCRSSLRLTATLLATLAAASCGRGTSAQLQVKADAEVDQYELIVRDDDASPKKILVKTGWVDATNNGKVNVGNMVEGIGINLPAAGNYSIFLFGLKGSVPCRTGETDDASVAISGDGGAPVENFGNGAEYYWATSGHFTGNENIAAHLYLVSDKQDIDCDGFPNASTWPAIVNPNPAIAATLLDCNDIDPDINPLAIPYCGEKTDVDCSGVLTGPCLDSDGDGDPDNTDCAPNDPTRHHPNAMDPYPQSPNCCGYSLGFTGAAATMSQSTSKLCHPNTCGTGIDYDCSGHPIDCESDQDCDKYLAAAVMQAGCSAPVNKPTPGNDCNDCDPKINPDAKEVCGDGIDNNCNGLTDEGCTNCDLDGDGYERMDTPNGCPDAKYMAGGKAIDCDDEDSGVWPSASMKAIVLPALTANGLKGVCDPTSPQGLLACAFRGYCRVQTINTVVVSAVATDCQSATMVTRMAGCPDPSCDADGDGFIDSAQVAKCDPKGIFAPYYDCNDKDVTVYYGAPDKCGDGTAQNCVADIPCNSITDSDKDGYSDDWDCAPTDATVHPNATEVCNGKDDNCDGLIDERNPDVSTGNPMGTSVQGDGTGCTGSDNGICANKPIGQCVCSSSSVSVGFYYTNNRTMCPDDKSQTDGSVAPRCYFAPQPKVEICDGLDDSCTGNIDIDPTNHLTASKLTDCPGPLPGMVCCPPPAGNTPPVCKNPMTDILNCGNCNQVCSTMDGTPTCSNSVCSINCNAGYADCNGIVGNMGAGTDGCETHTVVDVDNCGSGGGVGPNAPGCGVKCSAANVPTRSCVNGICNGTCANSFADCNGNKQTDGCETSTNDVNNCGVGGATGNTEANGQGQQGAGCGCVCATVNGTPACGAGACTITCNMGFANCDDIVGNSCSGTQTNGCEINTFNDPNNCGAGGGGDHTAPGCGVKCSTANVTAAACANGVCTSTCKPGYADCDNNKLSNGCEDNVAIDPANCGTGGGVGQGMAAGCGVVCSASHITTVTCGAGVCNGQCAAGYADCDNNKQTNGCEDNVATDANNCGIGGANGATEGAGQGLQGVGCGVVCSSANLTMRNCTAGICGGLCNNGFADCNANKQTDGCETSTYSVTNCGAGGAGGQGCGSVCSTKNGTPGCSTGSCTIVCNAGFANCNNIVGNTGVNSDGCEISTLTDVNNCGAGGGSNSSAPGCGVVCSTSHITAACTGGVCNGTCANGYADCNANKQTDGCEVSTFSVTNCGAGGAGGMGCGSVCSTQNGTPGCGAGTCTIACNAGFANCNNVVGNTGTNSDGCEITTSTDVNNCGAGGGTNSTAPGCGVVCSGANIVTRTCVAGVCGGTCNNGYADCDGNKQTNGCETSTYSVTNCGAGGAGGLGCGSVCSTKNGTPGCTAGSCTIACNAGFANCDNTVGNTGVNSNGCETSTLTDINNCGAGGGTNSMAPGCGVVCSGSHITAACSGGVCNGTCANGFADCNANKQTDGCETNTYSVTNCGAGGAGGQGCGSVCSTQNGTAGCTAGSCTIACNAGFANCDNVVGNTGVNSNGCETTTTTDINNCGAGGGSNSSAPGCGTVCSGSHITANCGAGVCNGACSAGYADCDGNKQTNGCEDNVANDPMNCGVGGNNGTVEGGGKGNQGAGCGSVCSTQHGTAACSTGVCSITCTAGFANCNNIVGNTGVNSDGCETTTSTDVNNCGAGGGTDSSAPGCGVVCSTSHITANCAGGVCNGACAAGYADCDGNKQANGCEDNVANDPMNCGIGGNNGANEGNGKGLQGVGCGVVCSNNNIPTPTCTAGVCGGTCAANFSDCDTNPANGCECDLTKNSCVAKQCLLLNGQTCANNGQCASTTCCGNVCVDETSNVNNCGACNMKCNGVTDQCVNSVCKCEGAAACSLGQRCLGGTGCVCDSTSCANGCCSAMMNGTCTNPATAANCGTMGATCTNCNAATVVADGCSNAGACTCGGNTVCATGQRCFGGACVCDATSCPSGCCTGANGTCVTVTSGTQCGAGGALCVDCTTNTAGSACVTVAGGGACGCGATTDCPSGASPRWCNGTSHACLVNGCDTLSNKCNGGCCNSSSSCVGGTANNACGTGGGSCMACTMPATCGGGMGGMPGVCGGP